MHKKTLPCLASPCCRADFVIATSARTDVHFKDELYEGELGCSACRAPYRVLKGVPVLMKPLSDAGGDEERLVARNKCVFDYIDRVADRHQLDDYGTEEQFRKNVRIERDFFGGAAVLDFGIDHGRYLPHVLESRPRILMGADFSDRVFRVYETLASRAGDTSLCLVQADPRHPPFKPGVFDIVLAIRIVHDFPTVLEKLVRLLRQGGRLNGSIFGGSGGPLYDFFRRAVRSGKAALRVFSLEQIHAWAIVPALALYVVVHAFCPFVYRLPVLGERLPFRRLAAEWARFRFSSLWLFVVFDLLVLELPSFVSRDELARLSARLPVARFEYNLQHEAVWTMDIVK